MSEDDSDIPDRADGEVWRTQTSTQVFHTSRCCSLENAEKVTTHPRQSLNRMFDECAVCAGKTSHNIEGNADD